MSNTTISPIFKFNFEQTDGTLTDLTGNGNNVAVKSTSACTPVADDPEMGRCMQFDGSSDSYILLSTLAGNGVSDLSTGYTLTAWVNPDTAVCTGNQGFFVFQLGLSNPNSYAQIGINNTQPYYRVWGGSNPPSVNATESVSASNWYHLAVSVDQSGKVIFYVNGMASGGTTNSGLLLTKAANYVAFGKDHTNPGSTIFSGMMAWAALYNGPLGPTEILADMAEGQAKRVSSFRQSTPIDFKLYSDDGGAESPIMFIEDEGAGENLNLRIINNSTKPITISKNNDPVSSTNYHFQLHFRPGVLSKNFLSNYSEDSTAKKSTNLPKLLANNPNWTAVVNGNVAGTDTISFLYNATTALTLAKGQDHLIVVSAVNASATGGTRNTNVELRYANIQLGTATNRITGHRKQNVSIVNHIGDKDIPLRAEIVGNASVMTYAKPADGSTVNNPPQSELSFRITNTGLRPLPLALPGTSDGGTTFTLSIDVQPENHLVEWALIDQGAVANISLSLNKLGTVRTIETSTLIMESPLIESLATGTSIDGGPNGLTVASPGALAGDYKIPVTTSPSDGFVGAEIGLSNNDSAWKTAAVATADAPPNTLQWTISNQTVQEISPGGGVSFLLKGIECSLPAGSSVINIGYDNVPGHWQGAFELTVEKSPMAFKQNLIGINTQDPKGGLHIQEENDYPPLVIGKRRVGIPKAPMSGNSVSALGGNWDWDHFLPLSSPNKYYNPNTYVNNVGKVVFDVFTLQDGDFTSESIVLSQEGNHGDSDSNEEVGVALFYHGWLYAISRHDEDAPKEINTYDFSSESTATFKQAFSVNEGGNTYQHQSLFICNGQLFTMASDQNHGGGAWGGRSFFMIQWQGMTTDGSAPNLSYKATPYFDANNPIWLNKVSGNYIYADIFEGPKNQLNVFQVHSDGTTQNVGSMNVQNKYYGLGTIKHVYDGFAYISGLKALNISDAASPTLYYQNKEPQVSGTQHAFYQNYLLIVDNVGSIYKLDEPDGPKLIKTVTWFNEASLYSFDDKIVVYPINAQGQESATAHVYDASNFFDILFGQDTYISSDRISIASKGLDENAGLILPYPTGANNNGVVIGETSEFTNHYGGLAIGMPENPDANPFIIYKNNSVQVVITTEGWIGIGTNSPDCPLDVQSSGNWKWDKTTTFDYLNGSDGQNVNYWSGKASQAAVSIKASNTIVCQQLFVLSDVRIKELSAPVDRVKDLSTLLSLRVSDYQYIDFIGKGTGQKKGLIAQQVKEVFPQAVNAENTDFIPEIYAMATDVGWQPLTKHLRVSLEKDHDLTVGDKVRLIAEKGFEEREVVAVPDNKSFVISEWEKPVDKLFVFGKEVHDFHTVDYDQVAMLGVSAIQALHAEVESLKKENEALKSQMQSEMAELKAEWAAFKSSLTKQHQN